VLKLTESLAVSRPKNQPELNSKIGALHLAARSSNPPQRGAMGQQQALDDISARLERAGYELEEPAAAEELLRVAQEFGLTPAAVVLDYDIMNDLR
jgi:hypothetical protein